MTLQNLILPPLNPMKDAPHNRPIWVRAIDGRYAIVEYMDCEWLRDRSGVPDCWRPLGGAINDIEPNEAAGWREATREEISQVDPLMCASQQ